MFIQSSWARQLIEDVTGYYTGSVYNEETLYRNGFIGEYDHPSSGRTVAIKNHGIAGMEYAEAIILIGNAKIIYKNGHFKVFNYSKMMPLNYRQNNL